MSCVPPQMYAARFIDFVKHAFLIEESPPRRSTLLMRSIEQGPKLLKFDTDARGITDKATVEIREQSSVDRNYKLI